MKQATLKSTTIISAAILGGFLNTSAANSYFTPATIFGGKIVEETTGVKVPDPTGAVTDKATKAVTGKTPSTSMKTITPSEKSLTGKLPGVPESTKEGMGEFEKFVPEKYKEQATEKMEKKGIISKETPKSTTSKLKPKSESTTKKDTKPKAKSATKKETKLEKKGVTTEAAEKLRKGQKPTVKELTPPKYQQKLEKKGIPTEGMEGLLDSITK